MTDAPHLPAEDRADFARVLDDALRDRSVLDALRTPGRHLSAEQLHTKAMLDLDAVAAATAEEYLHYTALRAALGPARDADGAPTPPSSRPRTNESVGLIPALTTLTPVLAGGAGAILLVLGYSVRAASPAAALGRPLVTAGWVSLAVGGAALLIGSVGMLLTALRDGRATPGGQDPQLHADLAEARSVWLTALRRRAILPYLLANLDSEPALSPHPAGTPVPPQLLRPGYSGAGFSSPGFSSPGVEGITDPDGLEPRHAEFSSPGYTSPDFTGPDEV